MTRDTTMRLPKTLARRLERVGHSGESKAEVLGRLIEHYESSERAQS